MLKLIFAIAILIALCSAFTQRCQDLERSRLACTFEYNPVCGIKNISNLGEQVKVSYPHKCLACRDPSIIYIVQGACEEYPKDAVFCHPNARLNTICTADIMPVCGYYNFMVSCIQGPCRNEFSNGCGACSQENITYYIQGQCDKDILS